MFGVISDTTKLIFEIMLLLERYIIRECFRIFLILVNVFSSQAGAGLVLHTIVHLLLFT